MKTHHLKTIKHLAYFLALLSAIGCEANEESKTEVDKLNGTPFTPPFSGLAAGTELQDECVIFENYAVKMTYIDTDYQFEIFKGSCGEKTKTYKGKLPADAMLAGEWNKLIVIDNGTGVDSRSLSLFNPESGNIVSEINYAIEPRFSENQITYYISTDKKATLENCPEQKDEFKEWQSFGLGIKLAKKEVFTLHSGEKTLLDEYACFAIQ